MAAAPPEEVWKLLFDPSRFPEWWVGMETVESAADGFTMWPAGYPDFPMPQQLRSERAEGRVTISCQVSDIDFRWRLSEGRPAGTRIEVEVDLPEREAHRLEGQREIIAESLERLAALAGAAGQGAGDARPRS